MPDYSPPSFRKRFLSQHLPFWVGYNLFWYLFFLFLSDGQPEWKDIPITLSYMLTLMAGTYVNIYYLMPRFLTKKRYWIYGFLALADVLFFAVILGICLYSCMSNSPSIAELIRIPEFTNATLGSHLSVMILTMSIKVFRDNRRTKKLNSLLQETNLETELKLLKAQLNPHFLFNAINSIYFLIHKNPDLAADSLARFSDILRYQLYECEEENITVSKEVEHLENFVNLARLRKGDRASIDLNIDPNVNGEKIAPFLLLPLVENAFKHVSDFVDQKNWIQIDLFYQENQFVFEIENTINSKAKVDSELVSYGGIGLENVKRRLALIYQKNHHFEIIKNDFTYKVVLRIPLSLGKSTQIPSNVFLHSESKLRTPELI